MSAIAPAPRKRRITVELLLGISSMVLSLGVLGVTVVQTNIARGQQYASVWPFLKVDIAQIGKQVTLFIKNKGIGPALIKRADLRLRGKAYPSYEELARTGRDPRLNGKYLGSATLEAGDVVQAGEEIKLLQIDSDRPEGWRAFMTDGNFAMNVVYGDVYGNCWLLANERVRPIGRCAD
jgi:hypothetical protein